MTKKYNEEFEGKYMKRTLNIETNAIKASDTMIVIWEEYRFTVLTNSMIRMEYSENGQFIDDPTKVVINRHYPEVSFDLKETEEALEIITSNIRLVFLKEKGGFTSNNLTVDVIGNYSTYHSSWSYGQSFETLKGTARTLDLVDGAVPLEEGLMNKNGYALIDDTETILLDENGWIDTKKENHVDLYFLGYGREYLQTLKDYFHLTGYPPLIPRYALGNWWSRYYPYSEDSYKELMARFEDDSVPLSVAVIDMDWHVTDVPSEYGSGWTGYTWNKDLFPDPPSFMKWLHNRDMKVSLNLHPAHGIQPHEEAYENMALAMEMDPSEKQGIEFDITNQNFLDAYFTHLHHPLEEDGVDFWWIDWQQGGLSKVNGADPLWMLNHYHYLDHARDGKRPLIFSRYAGLGSHRYPLGFSGDTITTWDSFKFQPYFTSTASNVGYTWWSHDIGGHMRGTKDRELYIRWLQYGVFSPINRLHSTGGKYNGKEPWRYGREAKTIVEKYLRLRHQLVPYLYSMNVLTHQEGEPLVKPMYYHHPWDEEAYAVENQYYFGTELIVAPATSKLNNVVQRTNIKSWLPKGVWFDYFTGTRYTGGRLVDLYRSMDNIPVFAKAGAVIPKASVVENNTDNPESIELMVFAGADGQFKLYEDDGESSVFDGSTTTVTVDWHSKEANNVSIRIKRPEGNTSSLPSIREFRLNLVGFSFNEEPALIINGHEHTAKVKRNGRNMSIDLPQCPLMTDYTLRIKNVRLQENDTRKQIETLLDEAQIGFDLKETIDQVVFERENNNVIIGNLLALDLDTDLIKALSELLLADASN